MKISVLGNKGYLSKALTNRILKKEKDFHSNLFGKSNDLLVQLLPTCPLRSINSIVKAIKLSLKNKVNLFSVSEYDFHIKFAISITNLKWRPELKIIL